ncbi:hypothetical protein B484DRAFT_403878, partial [Ochromonadaceae sp. CCMP2298]
GVLLFPRVESVTITFLTQKVVQDNKGAPDGLYYARREPRESRFMDDGAWSLSMDEIRVRGGWAPDSHVPEKHYARHAEGRGAFAVAEGQGEFTQHQLEGLARKPLGTCPDMSSGDEIEDSDPYDLDIVDEGFGAVDGGDSGEEGEDDLLANLIGALGGCRDRHNLAC